MLLAGRVRKQEEAVVIQAVIEKHFKKKLNPDYIFSEESMKKQMSRITEDGRDFFFKKENNIPLF